MHAQSIVLLVVAAIASFSLAPPRTYIQKKLMLSNTKQIKMDAHYRLVRPVLCSKPINSLKDQPAAKRIPEEVGI